MDKFRTVETLRASLVEINKFLAKLKEFIKDEKDAQGMYIETANKLKDLSRIERSFTTMYTEISGISRDEGRHEGIFTRMQRDTEQIRDRLIKEIKQLEDEERNKQVKADFHRYPTCPGRKR